MLIRGEKGDDGMGGEVEERTVKGFKLKCPICGYERFWSRTTLMSTRGATFLGFDWVNKVALNYVCGQCGYVTWFMDT
jgi:ribosomal protein S27AE